MATISYNIDIDIDDFYYNLSGLERKKLKEILKDEYEVGFDDKFTSAMDESFYNSLIKIINNRSSIPLELIKIIETEAKKY